MIIDIWRISMSGREGRGVGGGPGDTQVSDQEMRRSGGEGEDIN